MGNTYSKALYDCVRGFHSAREDENVKDAYGWAYYGCMEVFRLARQDRRYQEIMRERERYDAGYEEILGKLSEQDRDILLGFEECIGSMQFLETMMAYELGRKHPAASEEQNNGKK